MNANCEVGDVREFKKSSPSKRKFLDTTTPMEPSSPPRKRLRRKQDLTIFIPKRKPFLPVIPPPPSNFNSNSVFHQNDQTPLKPADFDRVDCLGKGCSGTVYKVLHRPTSQHYALKVVNVFRQEESIRDQICREIQIQSSLDHPNVVKCHGMIQEGDEFQIILDYMDGGSLKGTHIKDEPTLADHTRQMLSGLAYLYDRKIMHQDIKPSNLLINALNEVKIADFGVSQILSQGKSHSNSSVGTIAYMSPEKINCTFNDGTGVYDGYAADIWSLGVTILELYMGKFPIVIDHPGDWAGLVYNLICMSGPLEAPLTASREFGDFISCCLQKEAKRRSTVAELLLHPFITRQQLPLLQEDQPSSSLSSNGKLK